MTPDSSEPVVELCRIRSDGVSGAAVLVTLRAREYNSEHAHVFERSRRRADVSDIFVRPLLTTRGRGANEKGRAGAFGLYRS